MTGVDIDYLRQWIGRAQSRTDRIDARLAASYDAVFDMAGPLVPSAPAPLGIQWCLAPDIAPMSRLGADGHPARGEFLPPVPFQRRMWAGGSLVFRGRFEIGDEVTKNSVIDDVVLKTGRSGALIFVTVSHAYRTASGTVIDERQDIVYREQDAGGRAPPSEARPQAVAERRKTVEATAPLLFRYSAITFNGHRIHYDLDYVTAVEGYPGLIFHGPLQASYLLRLAAEVAGAAPSRFSFRSVRPLFAGGEISLNARRDGDGMSLWIADQAGHETMTASAHWD